MQQLHLYKVKIREKYIDKSLSGDSLTGGVERTVEWDSRVIVQNFLRKIFYLFLDNIIYVYNVS